MFEINTAQLLLHIANAGRNGHGHERVIQPISAIVFVSVCGPTSTRGVSGHSEFAPRCATFSRIYYRAERLANSCVMRIDLHTAGSRTRPGSVAVVAKTSTKCNLTKMPNTHINLCDNVIPKIVVLEI